MLSSDFPGRDLVKVSGRVLVWVAVVDVQFVPMNRKQTIPLFFDDDNDVGGRFLAELNGYLSIPKGAEILIHDTGEPYHSFHVPDQITPAGQP
jgi:hypothetical protein